MDHVFLTDNGSADITGIKLALWSHFPPDFLTLREEPMSNGQMKVYAWCAETQRARFNWLAFLDLDEYLVFQGLADPADPPEIHEFLDDFKDEPGLSVNWIWVGPSGRETRPEGGGVLRHYDQCAPEPTDRFKTIVNTWWLEGTSQHPHNCVFRCAVALFLSLSLSPSCHVHWPVPLRRLL